MTTCPAAFAPPPVTFENVRVSFDPNAKPDIPAMQNFAQARCRLGLYFENVSRVRLKNVRLQGVAGEAVIAEACGSVEKEGLLQEE